MSFLYEAFGQLIQADTALPSLPRCHFTLSPTITIYNSPYPDLTITQKHSWARSADLAPTGLPWFTIQRFTGEGGLFIQLGNGIEFVIDGTGRHIWSTALTGESSATARTYLYGFIFGLAFYLQGATCLHASAVAVDDKAILFVGDAGFGKSSMAAIFVLQGFPLISDDLVVLDPKGHPFLVPPAIPAIRLRPDFATLMFGSEAELPLDDGYTGKYSFELDEKSPLFVQQPKELAAIYMLSRASQSAASATISQLSPKEALLNLSRFGYLPTLIDKNMRRAEFELLSSLVRSIPVFQLPEMEDPGQLPDLGHDIVESFRTRNLAGLL